MIISSNQKMIILQKDLLLRLEIFILYPNIYLKSESFTGQQKIDILYKIDQVKRILS